MKQIDGINLEESVGYALKETASALRAAMENALRPLGMTITHYACLELLGQRPGMSNSELARGAFVTRQSMNVLLHSLEREGAVIRPESPATGRALPAQLTPQGEQALVEATAAVRDVELTMLGDITEHERTLLFRLLQRMTTALRERQ